MNRLEAKRIVDNIAWIREFAEGKEVQHYGGEWSSHDTFTFTDAPANYRLKPEPREFWIRSPYESGVTYALTEEEYESGEWENENIIKVREVLDDE